MNGTRHRLLLLLAAGLVSTAAGPSEAATVHLTGPAGAEVRINDRRMGQLPVAPLDMAAGVYEITCRARGYEPLTQTLVAPEGDALVHVRLRPLQLRRGRAVTGSLLYAGLGQWYSGARIRGWVYFVGETTGLLAALAGEVGRINQEDEHVNAIRNYEAAVSPDQIAYWRRTSQTTYQDLQDMEDLRDTGLMIAVGSWALSLLDAYLLFPTVDVGPGPVPPTAATGAVEPHPTPGLHAAVSIGF